MSKLKGTELRLKKLDTYKKEDHEKTKLKKECEKLRFDLKYKLSKIEKQSHRIHELEEEIHRMTEEKSKTEKFLPESQHGNNMHNMHKSNKNS